MIPWYVSSVGSMAAKVLRAVDAVPMDGDEGNRNVSHQTTTTGAHLTSEDVNFLDLDLNLLVALDALLGEQSVTRAAEVLQRSQPALSASLKRLRHQFQDDLLVRVGNHYELTPLAHPTQGAARRW